MRKTKFFILPFLLLIISLFAFSFLVIKDFQHPLFSSGDSELWEYMGFYFAKNLNLWPFPHLDLINNQVFYPYGINSVFQAWGIEMDLFYSFFYSFFGLGPWLQFYYLLSVFITAVGVFLLLFQDYGIVRATGTSLTVIFLNFYAIFRYTIHLNIAIIHWTILSLVADFILVKRIVFNQHISIIFILIRILLLILSFGQDLGYILGYALMSLTISLVFIILLTSYRYYQDKTQVMAQLTSELKLYKDELLRTSVTLYILLSLILFFSYFYLSLAFQIFREALSFDFSGVLNSAWWFNPLRILIPFLPNFNPIKPPSSIESVFRDVPEWVGSLDGTSSSFLLILAIIGLWQSRHKLHIYTPLLIIFFLCLLYVPTGKFNFSILQQILFKSIYVIFTLFVLWLTRRRKNIFIPSLIILFVLFIHIFMRTPFPTLKIFPWFTFNRVAGRSTVIYPVILSLFALNIDLHQLNLLKKRIITAFLISLVCLELYTAYSLKSSAYSNNILSQDFLAYMNYVKQQPGEAVLDWPFCIAGGNGVGGNKGLCPLYNKNNIVFTLRKFHNKKVLGQYFGRLHPSQLEDYLQAGWDILLVADDPDIQGKRKKF